MALGFVRHPFRLDFFRALKMGTETPFLLIVLLVNTMTALSDQPDSADLLSWQHVPAVNNGRSSGEVRDNLIRPDPHFWCPSDGVWPHPFQCNLYYTCYLDNPAYLWKCRDGLLYDLLHGSCNLPSLTICGDRVRSGIIASSPTATEPSFICPDDGFFPISPNACSIEFFNCVEGIAYLQTCPGNGIFEPSQSTCVAPDHALCMQTMTTIPNPIVPYLCTEDGFYPFSPNACSTSYINCFAGVAYVNTCPGDGVFDPVQRICVSADATVCGFICPAQDGLYGFPDECSNRFYSCVQGVANENFCPGDFIFDPVRGICAAPETVDCYQSSTTNSKTTETTQRQTISATTVQPPVEFVCPEDYGFYPNPENCTTFYQCTGGKPYLKSCPDGLYFNPETIYCDYLDNVPSCQEDLSLRSIELMAAWNLEISRHSVEMRRKMVDALRQLRAKLTLTGKA